MWTKSQQSLILKGKLGRSIWHFYASGVELKQFVLPSDYQTASPFNYFLQYENNAVTEWKQLF